MLYCGCHSTPEEEMEEDRKYVLKKLDISEEEWEAIMSSPYKTEDDYPNNKKALQVSQGIKHMLIRQKNSN